MFVKPKPLTPEVKIEIEVLNLAWRLFQAEYQDRLKWIDAGTEVQQRFLQKARSEIDLPDNAKVPIHR